MLSLQAPYNPNNWSDPLDGSMSPENFVLADIDFMPPFPSGLVEIIPGSYESHGHVVPIDYRRYEVRTFVMSSPDGRAALIRLNGDYLDRAIVEDYLQYHARYVDGVIIRELGLLGAALYEAAYTFSRTVNVMSTLRPLGHIPDGYDMPATFAVGTLQPSHPFLKLLATIELRSDVPDWLDLVATETPMRDFIERWHFLKTNLADWISRGQVPFGLSAYTDIEGNGNYRLRPIPLVGRSAHAIARSRGMTHSDIYLLADPKGDVCMMAVNSLDAAQTSGNGESAFFTSVRSHYWQLNTYVRKSMHSDWAFFDGLLLEIASGLLREKRSRGEVAWHLPELPTLSHRDRDVASPFVLNAVIVEADAFGLDLLKMIREG